MPQSRLSREYLTKFLFKNGIYRYRIRMLNCQPWLRPLVILPYAINDLKESFYIGSNINDIFKMILLL
jgi:hypothetical protein